ncbi:hypothetical protein BDFB_006801 [Asbolus verrucosus]|uniref:Uncharacterized protein n=1 Tax=Asbolus verrucosus TaxID=1661398 RepID=A0A482W4D6_ASBVE|nr:hypothetical protein BDFB_006801 [Asbolus verrucosus]
MKPVHIFITCYMRSLIRFVSTHSRKKKKYPTWYSKELENALRKKNSFLKKYKKTGNDYFQFEFVKWLSQMKLLQKSDYDAYLYRVQQTLKSRPNQFWSYVRGKKGITYLSSKMLLNNVEVSFMPNIIRSFAEFFSGKKYNYESLRFRRIASSEKYVFVYRDWKAESRVLQNASLKD